MEKYKGNFYNLKRIGKSDTYPYVKKYVCNKTGKIYYRAEYTKNHITRYQTHFYDDERYCALWADKQLLADGYEPVNILKKQS